MNDTVDLYRFDDIAALRGLTQDFFYGDTVARMLREEGVVGGEDEGA